MKVRIFEGVVGYSGTTLTHQVKEGTSIVFLTPSVLSPICCARFYDVDDVLHQIPATQVVSIDPDLPDLRLPVRYLDPDTGEEVTHRAR